jgi:WD40 repeat protein
VRAAWQTGDVILDTYEIRHIFTSGGMGLVYHVHHRGWNIDLVMKSPRPEIIARYGEKEFVTEANTWVGLGFHPNIACCYYVRKIDGRPRVFAEFVDGGSLKDWIDDRRLYQGDTAQALERILNIAIQFAWGLAYAHQQGLVHQDVKPGNVLMTAAGETKVTDFGLAKARAVAGRGPGGEGEANLLVSAAGGTPAFRSPEQAHGERLSIHTDIWSWAVSILEMFTGEIYWQFGEAAGEVLEEFLEEGSQDAHLPAMPAALGELLSHCLRHAPAERPPDMLDVARRLQDIYRQATGGAYLRQPPEAARLRANSLNNRGLSLMDLDDEEGAAAAWEGALAIDPHHPEAVYNLGRFTWQMNGQTDLELVAQMRAVTAAHPGSPRAYELLAAVLAERGDLSGALEALQQAVTNEPGDQALQNRRSELSSLSQLAPQPPVAAYLMGYQARSYAISPDERTLASKDTRLGPGLYDLESGQRICEFAEHVVEIQEGQPIRSSAAWMARFTPDGKFVVGNDRHGEICCWDATTGRLVRAYEKLTHSAWSLAISSDGKQLLCGGIGGEMALFDLESGVRIHGFEQKPGRASFPAFASGRAKVLGDMSFFPGEPRAFVATSLGAVEIWNTETGALIDRASSHSGSVQTVAISQDGALAFSGGVDSNIILWNPSPLRPWRIFAGHKDQIHSLAISADGHHLFSSSKDKTIRTWDIQTGRCLRTFEVDEPGAATVFALSKTATGRDQRGPIHLIHYDPRACRPADWAVSVPESAGRLLENRQRYESLYQQAHAASEQGDYPAAASCLNQAFAIPGYQFDARLLVLWQETGHRGGRRTGLRSAVCRGVLQGHTGPVTGIGLSPDLSTAYSTGLDGSLKIWDLNSGGSHDLPGVAGEKGGLAISPNRERLLTWPLAWSVRMQRGYGACAPYHDPNLFLLNAQGELLRTFQAGSGTVETAGFFPDGSYIFAGGEDKLLRVWETNSGRLIRELSGLDQRISAACLSGDGGRIFAAGEAFYNTPMKDPHIYAWDLASGEQVARFLEPVFGAQFHGYAFTGGVRAMCIRADEGKLLYARGNSVYAWDLHGPALLGSLVDEQNKLTCVEGFPDGRYALAAGESGAIQVCDLWDRKWLQTLEGHTKAVTCLALGADGSLAISASEDETLRVWELNWEYEFPARADWDEGARPYLETFLARHTPSAGLLPQDRPPGEEEVALASSRGGQAVWTEEDLLGLLHILRCAGYGWLRPEGVRRQLEQIVS